MTAYPDTSFLYAFYVRQSHSSAAAAYAATMREPLHVTTVLGYEFRQSLRFQTWRRSVDPREWIAPADPKELLTFDVNQRKLAAAGKLAVKP